MGRGRTKGDFWFEQEKAGIAASLGYGSINEAMVALYEGGKSLQEVGDIFEMSKMGVRYTLTRQGVEMRAQGGPNRKPGTPWLKNRFK